MKTKLLRSSVECLSGLRAVFVAIVLVGCSDIDAPVAFGGCSPQVACEPAPVAVIGNHQFTSLASGRYHTCGLKASGEAWCWGLNTAGQLGAALPDLVSGTPVRVAGQIVFRSISAGDFHTCAIASDDAVYCWGANVTSVLGVETVSEQCSLQPCSRSPVRAGGASFTATSLDAGATHNCALDSSGTVSCWGFNVLGEVGSASFGTGFFAPQPIQGGPFSSVSAGLRFNCALNPNGALACWGAADEGQLATVDVETCGGTLSPRCSTVPLNGNTTLTFTQITTGDAFACAIAATGTLHCWGRNSEGQLGNGGFAPSATPVAVQTSGTWESVVAGYFHACALRSNGAAFCWGLNDTAQLGDGSTAIVNSVPQPVQGGRTFSQLVAGSDHTCGLAADGTAWCWGNNQVNQLGDG